MESTTDNKPQNLLQGLSPDLLGAIQTMIDQKVDEKFSKFQQEYDDIMNKMKKQMAQMILKPGGAGIPGFGANRKEVQSESVKGRSNGTTDKDDDSSRP